MENKKNKEDLEILGPHSRNAETVEYKSDSYTNDIGSLGATSKNFEKHLRGIPGKHNSTALIKSALLEGLTSYVMCLISKESGRFSRSVQDKRLQLTTAVIEKR